MINKRQRWAWAAAVLLGLVIGADFVGGHRVLQQDTAVQSELVSATTRKESASVSCGIRAVTCQTPSSVYPGPPPPSPGPILSPTIALLPQRPPTAGRHMFMPCVICVVLTGVPVDGEQLQTSPGLP